MRNRFLGEDACPDEGSLRGLPSFIIYIPSVYWVSGVFTAFMMLLFSLTYKVSLGYRLFLSYLESKPLLMFLTNLMPSSQRRALERANLRWGVE